jgi:uncharacterized protein YjbI with pentapeptide repeats
MTPKLVKFLTAVLLVISLGEAAPVKAADPNHVKRLLETKECSECDLSRANLSGADLSFAILVNANLMNANLKGANLSGADLTRANLSEADLRQASLNQAVLTSANLNQTNLIGASTNGSRGLPVIAVLSSIPPVTVPPQLLPPKRLTIPSAVFVPSQVLPPRRPTISISSSPISQRTPPLSEVPLLRDVMAAPPQKERPPQTIAQLTQTIAQLTQAQNYLRAHWRPPNDLTQTLEYSLTLNADGSITQMIPLGKAAGDYIDRTGIPLPGEPFVSPREGGVQSTIRVVFQPDGNVQALWER